MPESEKSTENPLGDRRLAAIVFTDVAGFSSLTEKDEKRTLLLVQRDLKLITEVCRKYGGDVLKNTGDGCLATFTSVEAAVRSAMKIQRIIAEAAGRLPPENILHHRIGIHLGDVFVRQGDVLGNGVNIAARLLGEAQPDGICISQTVYDLVKHRLDVKAISIGARELKNIREAMQVYRLVLNAAAEEQGDSLPAARLARRKRSIIITAGLLAVAALAIAAWVMRSTNSPAPSVTSATPPATSPAIAAAPATRPVPAAVMPLEVMQRNPDFTADSPDSWQTFPTYSNENLSYGLEGNVYVMLNKASPFRRVIAPSPWGSFDDVTIEVIARNRRPQASRWGLGLLAAHSDDRKIVRIGIAGNGIAMIDYSSMTGFTADNRPLRPDDVVTSNDGSIRRMEYDNTMVLAVRDHVLSVFVNGQSIGAPLDITPLGSTSLLLTVEGPEGARAEFSKVRIWLAHPAGSR